MSRYKRLSEKRFILPRYIYIMDYFEQLELHNKAADAKNAERLAKLKAKEDAKAERGAAYDAKLAAWAEAREAAARESAARIEAQKTMRMESSRARLALRAQHQIETAELKAKHMRELASLELLG